MVKYELPVKYSKLNPQQKREVRMQYIEEQDHKCQFCKEPLSGDPSGEVKRAGINLKLFPPRFFDYPIHLHHDHESDDTIGAVHAKCNAYLWQYYGE